jgi:ribose transport system substrate-binding protein
MLKTDVTLPVPARRWRRWSPAALTAAASLVLASLLLAACGSSSSSNAGNAATSSSPSGTSSGGGSNLILLELPFPCGLNNFATDMCNGVKAAAKQSPAGYTLQIKTAVNYNDQQSFNNLVQTSLQLKPAGILAFANGAAAQTPYLNQGCAQGVKVIFLDTAGKGVKCQVSFVTAPNDQMGAADAKYLIAHPPKNGSKQVIVVSQQPGLFNSNDERVAGFEQALKGGGYQVVQTVLTTNDLTQTRTAVTNAVTAHPNVGAIFSANGPMGDGTKEALRNNHTIVQLTLDGAATDIPDVLNGTVAADTAQSPYQDGFMGAQLMIKALGGQKIPALQQTPIEVVDNANAQAYLNAGGSLR